MSTVVKRIVVSVPLVKRVEVPNVHSKGESSHVSAHVVKESCRVCVVIKESGTECAKRESHGTECAVLHESCIECAIAQESCAGTVHCSKAFIVAERAVSKVSCTSHPCVHDKGELRRSRECV